jgi:hypothetical protein
MGRTLRRIKIAARKFMAVEEFEMVCGGVGIGLLDA